MSSLENNGTESRLVSGDKQCTTVRTRINGPCARPLDLPLLVRSGVFFSFVFWCVFDPFSRGGNFGLSYIA